MLRTDPPLLAVSIFSAAVLLFFILDPLGNLPVFNHLLGGVAPERRGRVVLRECLIALVALLVFLFLGRHILGALSLRQESLSIGGGVVLFLIALKMVFPEHGVGASRNETRGEEPFIVPLAIPLVVGPSALAFLLLLTSKHPGRVWDWALAVVAAWAATTALLLVSARIENWLGARTPRAIEKLAGMLLILIAVQMFLDGLAKR